MESISTHSQFRQGILGLERTVHTKSAAKLVFLSILGVCDTRKKERRHVPPAPNPATPNLYATSIRGAGPQLLAGPLLPSRVLFFPKIDQLTGLLCDSLCTACGRCRRMKSKWRLLCRSAETLARVLKMDATDDPGLMPMESRRPLAGLEQRVKRSGTTKQNKTKKGHKQR